MTGFGIGSAPFGDGRIVVEIRTVNHRFLEIRCRSSRELAAAEALAERLVRKALNRGHCTVGLTFETASGTAKLDTNALTAHLGELSRIAAMTGVPLASLVPILAAAPDLYAVRSSVEPEVLETAVGTACNMALENLLAMREREGLATSRELSERLAELACAVARMKNLFVASAAISLERARQKMTSLLEGSGAALERGRLEAEVALLADRLDISEEVSRLASHCDQMSRLIAADDPVGRRMDFLIQEMSREANTAGAKSASAELSHTVVEFKAALEKMRELVQNVE